MRGEKLPGGTLGIADGDPGLADEIDVAREPLDFTGLEVEGIRRDEDHGVGAAEDLDGAADVAEGAEAGGDVVTGFVGFEVLVFVVELDMAAGEGVAGAVVVLHMVGAEAKFLVLEVHVAIGDEEVALALLRTAGGKRGVAAFAGGEMDLLGRRGGNSLGRCCDSQKREERRKEEKRAAQGGVHSKHPVQKTVG